MSTSAELPIPKASVVGEDRTVLDTLSTSYSEIESAVCSASSFSTQLISRIETTFSPISAEDCQRIQQTQDEHVQQAFDYFTQLAVERELHASCKATTAIRNTSKTGQGKLFCPQHYSSELTGGSPLDAESPRTGAEGIRTKTNICSSVKPSLQDAIFPLEFANYNFPFLYGRGKEIRQLETIFWGDDIHLAGTELIDHCIIQVIGAMGGAGKTTLAAFYARRFRTAYGGGVFKFDAQSSLALHKSLREHITRLTGETLKHGTLKGDYQHFLSLLAGRGNVLLVFDSCDELNVIENLLPNEDKSMHVIITTRRVKGHRVLEDRTVNVIRLGRLQENDAVRATLSWAGRSDDLSSLDEDELSSVRLLVNASGIEALPLALRHVGTHLKEGELSCKHYWEVVKSRKAKVQLKTENMDEFLKYCGLQYIGDFLREEGIETVTSLMNADLTELCNSLSLKSVDLKQLKRKLQCSQSTTAMAWEVDIDEVTRRSSVARNILELASLLDCKSIPRDLLAEVALPGCSEKDDGERQVSLRLAITLLSSFSLLLEDDYCSMHSLVQQSVVEAMVRDRTLSGRLRSLSEYLTRILPQSGNDIKRSLNDSRVLSLAPHVYTVASHILDSEEHHQECWQMLMIACWLAIHFRHLHAAEDLSERKAAFINKLLRHKQEVTHEKLLQSLLDLGFVRLLLGNPLLAKVPLERALDVSREADGGQTHSGLHAEALDLLGACYRDLQRFEDAEKLFVEEVHFMQRHGFSEEYVSNVVNNLALTYHKWGKICLAMDKYEECLTMKRRECNSNPVDLATSLINFGFCIQESGQLERALAILEEAVTICRRELPATHPKMAIAIRRLSDVYQALGRFDIALPLAVDALAAVSASLSNHHPDVGWYTYSVAECHRGVGASEKAIEFYEKAIEIFGHDVSAQMHSLAVVKGGLARAHSAMGRKDNAMALISESMEIKIQYLPARHPDIARSLVDLGAALYEKEDFTNAAKHLQGGLSILREAIPRSEITTNCLHWLGLTAMKLDNLEEAQQHLIECLRLRRVIYPNGHTEIVSAESLLQEIVEKLSVR